MLSHNNTIQLYIISHYNALYHTIAYNHYTIIQYTIAITPIIIHYYTQHNYMPLHNTYNILINI